MSAQAGPGRVTEAVGGALGGVVVVRGATRGDPYRAETAFGLASELAAVDQSPPSP